MYNGSESGLGGWKTQGGGKHTVNSAKNPSPKTFLDPPPTIRFPPPFFWRLSVVSLKRERHRPDQAQFLRPPKVVLESTLCSTFSPPQIHAIRFAPPSAAAQMVGDGCWMPMISEDFPNFPNQCGKGLQRSVDLSRRAQLRRQGPQSYDPGGPWLFAQNPFEAPNRPKPPQTPKFPENPALPRNPPGIPTEFILSAIPNPTEFH